MENWRSVWRNGFVPCLSTRALVALRDGLRSDDLRLMQGNTTLPPSLPEVDSLPVDAACAVGYCGWQGETLTSVAEVTHYFNSICFEADQNLREPGACRWFLNWFDDMPRNVVVAELLPEVELALGERLPSFPLPLLRTGDSAGCLLAAI